jgi:glutamine amidotransferase
MIGIINYGSGNVGAISNIYKELKIPHFISSNLGELERAERYVLPGVGAFDATMKNLADLGLVGMLNEQVYGEGKKILGVCVGMQILAASSEEGVLPGLGWIEGRVTKISASGNSTPLALPHMGWNSVRLKVDHPLFHSVEAETGFYFLHNYYFDAAHGEDIYAVVQYGAMLPCVVAKGNVMGVQFHPEKSHHNGVTIFRNFAAL